jgi:hypothetical protein
MELLGTIADGAAVGAVLGAAAAIVLKREEVLTEWTARGMVLGGALGALIVGLRALLSVG